MTDTYGTEPHDHESAHEGVSVEQDDVVEPPSDYEFSDEQEHAAQPPESRPAPRSLALPIAAAVGGMLFLGAVAWFQFSGPLSEPPPAATGALPALSVNPETSKNAKPVDVRQASDAAGVPVAPKTASASAPSSSAPDMTALPKTAASGDAATLSAAALSVASSALPAAAPVVPVAASAAPPAAGAGVLASSVPAAPSAVLPAASAPVSFAPAVSNDDAGRRIEMLTARVDSLQKALDQANQQLGQVTNMVAATASVGGAAPAPSKELQDRLDSLEQQLAALRHPAAVAPGSSAPSALSVAAVGAAPARKTAAPHVRTRKETHNAAHKAIAKKAPEQDQAIGAWVLRAASPGQAWVGATATSHDLKQVHVGDTLPGIGRVTAIQQQGDSWAVQGTKGVIR